MSSLIGIVKVAISLYCIGFLVGLIFIAVFSYFSYKQSERQEAEWKKHEQKIQKEWDERSEQHDKFMNKINDEFKNI